MTKPAKPALDTATFAGGCFWCIEASFDNLPGVISTISGYTGGELINPTYEQVCSGGSGHLEAVEVQYDPEQISYEELLNAFWRMIDPTDNQGQFADRGHQYGTAIFYHNDSQRIAAEKSRAALVHSGRYAKPIVTAIRPATVFYPAEDYHQDFHRSHAAHYQRYRRGSGRDQYLAQIWGQDLAQEHRPAPSQGARAYPLPSQETLQLKLSPLQFAVTQHEETEAPFDNDYWNEKREGLYVDITTGQPLFSSKDKYDSGSGWPSFTQPLSPDLLSEKNDYTLVIPRTEVHSRHGKAHLGHVFKDGPLPTGLRYCINSAALRFIPKEELEQEGYGDYLVLFE